MRQTYTNGEITISADLDQAAAVVTYEIDGDANAGSTPFQTADGAHNADKLLQLVNAWLDSEA